MSLIEPGQFPSVALPRIGPGEVDVDSVTVVDSSRSTGTEPVEVERVGGGATSVKVCEGSDCVEATGELLVNERVVTPVIESGASSGWEDRT